MYAFPSRDDDHCPHYSAPGDESDHDTISTKYYKSPRMLEFERSFTISHEKPFLSNGDVSYSLLPTPENESDTTGSMPCSKTMENIPWGSAYDCRFTSPPILQQPVHRVPAEPMTTPSSFSTNYLDPQSLGNGNERQLREYAFNGMERSPGETFPTYNYKERRRSLSGGISYGFPTSPTTQSSYSMWEDQPHQAPEAYLNPQCLGQNEADWHSGNHQRESTTEVATRYQDNHCYGDTQELSPVAYTDSTRTPPPEYSSATQDLPEPPKNEPGSYYVADDASPIGIAGTEPRREDSKAIRRDRSSSKRKKLETIKAVKPTQRFQCEVAGCGESYTAKHNLQRHIDSHHLKLKKFVCLNCARGFTTSSDLARHSNSKTACQKNLMTRARGPV